LDCWRDDFLGGQTSVLLLLGTENPSYATRYDQALSISNQKFTLKTKVAKRNYSTGSAPSGVTVTKSEGA